MGYAPISRVVTAPDPEDSGTVLHVQHDSGDRFPIPPFTALLWPSQTIPTIGLDSEEPTVVSIEGDVLTLVRGDRPVRITTEMHIAALRTMPSFSIGEQVALAQEFPASDTGVTLALRAPGGTIETVTGALAESATDGGSTYTHAFEAQDSGHWFYDFTSDQRVKREQDFFVRFSEVF